MRTHFITLLSLLSESLRGMSEYNGCFYCRGGPVVWFHPPLHAFLAVNGAAPNSEKPTLVLAHVCFLTSHSRACSRAGGPCSNRCRWARLNTRRTWRRSRARSARSRAAGSGRRWETRSPHTALPLPWTPDLEGPHYRSGWTDRCNYRPQFMTPSGHCQADEQKLVHIIKSEIWHIYWLWSLNDQSKTLNFLPFILTNLKKKCFPSRQAFTNLIKVSLLIPITNKLQRIFPLAFPFFRVPDVSQKYFGPVLEFLSTDSTTLDTLFHSLKMQHDIHCVRTQGYSQPGNVDTLWIDMFSDGLYYSHNRPGGLYPYNYYGNYRIILSLFFSCGTYYINCRFEHLPKGVEDGGCCRQDCWFSSVFIPSLLPSVWSLEKDTS